MKTKWLASVLGALVLLVTAQANVSNDEQMTMDQQKKAQNLTEGDRVELNCMIMLASNYSLDPVAKMTWYFSGKRKQGPANATVRTEGDPSKKNDYIYNNGVYYINHTYIIDEVSKEHEGTYECHANLSYTEIEANTGQKILHTELKIVETRRILVHSRAESMIDMTLDCEVFTTSEGENVVWKGIAEKDVNLTWFGLDSNGVEVEVGKSERFSIDQPDNTDKKGFTLTILNANSADGKQYSVKARKGSETKTINMKLAVTKPLNKLRTHVTTSQKLYDYKPDQVSTANCTLEGKQGESSKVEIIQQDCANNVNRSLCSGHKFHYIYQVPENTKFITLSNWDASRTGKFVCQELGANNTYYTNTTNTKSTSRTNKPEEAFFCVTDFRELKEHVIYYKGRKEENRTAIAPDLNSTVILSCLSSYCNDPAYKVQHVRWVQQKSTGLKEVLNLITPGVFSVRADVVIGNISKGDGGTYICKVGNVSVATVEINMGPENAEQTASSSFVAVIICAVLVILLASGVALYVVRDIYRKKQDIERNRIALEKFQKGNMEELKEGESMYAHADLLPFDKEWEFPRDNLRMGRKLGAGFFGMVFEAEAEGLLTDEDVTVVAVKSVRKHADLDVVKAFEKEIKIMANLEPHPHIVNMLGAVVDRLAQRELMLIVEYCKHGCLLDYLKNHRERFINLLPSGNTATTVKGKVHTYNNTGDGSPMAEDLPFDTNVLMEWSYQTARGMEWLASKKILHCDLAARNILITEKNIVKIADFGLAHDLYSKDEYRKKKGAKMPLKWMAIESIQDQRFTSQSDVWSYGVLLWEIFTLGRAPYADFECFNDIWKAIKMTDGYRLEKPEYGSVEIYDIMKLCWKEDPRMRPTFTTLSGEILALLEETTQANMIKIEKDYQGTSRTGYMAMSGKPKPAKRGLMMSYHSYINETSNRLRKIFDRKTSADVENNYSMAYIHMQNQSTRQDELLLPTGFENPNAMLPGSSGHKDDRYVDPMVALKVEGYGSILTQKQENDAKTNLEDGYLKLLENPLSPDYCEPDGIVKREKAAAEAQKSPKAKEDGVKMTKEFKRSISDTKEMRRKPSKPEETHTRKNSDPPPIPPKSGITQPSNYTEPRPIVVDNSDVKLITLDKVRTNSITSQNEYTRTPESYLDPIAEITERGKRPVNLSLNSCVELRRGENESSPEECKSPGIWI